MIDWLLPLKIYSPNRKEHWSKSYARNKHAAMLIEKQWSIDQPKIKPPCTVTLIRQYHSTYRMMDKANLDNAFKGIQDIIANILVPGLRPGQADHPKYGITFKYDQESGMKPAIRIIITKEKSNGSILD